MNLIGSRSVWLLLMAIALCWEVATGQTRNAGAGKPELVTASNRFGFALLPQLEEQGRNDNIFYSPLSMTLALSMAYNGARGDTEQAMRRALGLEKLSLEELNQASASLLQELTREDAALKLTIANSLWTHRGVAFNRDFLTRNRKFYRADVSVLNFGDPGSVATINDWVARRTNGKIPVIIDELERDDRLVLINAVYFKGAWTFPFAPSQTSYDVFYLPGGAPSQVSMMNKRDDLQCYSGDGVDAAVLPYGSLSAQMELFLPAPGVSITDFLRKFDHETYLRWKQSFSSGSVTLRLPRVKLQYLADLKPSLRRLGMDVALTRAADFEGMTSVEKLFISKVSHKAALELDEKGTEAAAVTGIVGKATSGGPPPRPCTLIANRPFIVVITDRMSNAILFMGVVTNPQPGTN
jgi:serine protease inhibitor